MTISRNRNRIAAFIPTSILSYYLYYQYRYDSTFFNLISSCMRSAPAPPGPNPLTFQRRLFATSAAHSPLVGWLRCDVPPVWYHRWVGWDTFSPMNDFFDTPHGTCRGSKRTLASSIRLSTSSFRRDQLWMIFLADQNPLTPTGFHSGGVISWPTSGLQLCLPQSACVEITKEKCQKITDELARIGTLQKKLGGGRRSTSPYPHPALARGDECTSERRKERFRSASLP